MGYKFKVFLVDDEVGELDLSENKLIQPGLHYGKNKVIPIEWVKKWLENCDTEFFDNIPISTYCDGYQNNVIECLLNSWEKENK